MPLRRLARYVSRRMVVKIFLALAVALGVALAALAWRQATDAMHGLRDATRKSGEQLAASITASIEHAMLDGDGIKVDDLVDRLKQRNPAAEIRIYDPRGSEVFGDPAPPPDPATLPRPLARALAGERAVEDGVVYLPIANEPACHRCHRKEDLLRAVLAYKVDRGRCAAERETAVPAIVRDAFVQVMTATGSADQVEAYVRLLRERSPVAAAVFDRDGERSFGAAIPGYPDAMAAGVPPPGSSRVLDVPGGRVALLPLEREERCGRCHDDTDPVRGTLAVMLPRPRRPGCDDAELEVIVDASLRSIMLAGLGRLINYHLDAVHAVGPGVEARLYDNRGRLYYEQQPPPPDRVVEAVLRTGRPSAQLGGSGEDERMVVVEPLLNEPRCTQCHGSAMPLRGAVGVSLSTAEAVRTRDRAVWRAAVAGAAALLCLLVLLVAMIRGLVVRPVRRIGVAADAVGEGNLDVAVAGGRADGDEVARLGHRMNQMIHGLRAKLELTKFVSKGAAAAAEDAAGTAPVVGVRRQITVLFTDIRGFTAFSETVPPEHVVDMLNRLLECQAAAVERHGGDIDKFVGDEVMVLFAGADAETRAVRCALDMIAAVDGARGGEGLAIGAGIASGDVVYGPIGSRRRKDFTVIGDVVNTGARLCSAAAPGETLVTARVRDGVAEAADVDFVAREPLAVKGKREPLAVFRAARPAT